MKSTRFNSIHKQLGAKMVEFAGFEMPIQYPAGIIHEHMVVREKVGVFDVSHMGEFDVTGPDALKFIQKCTVNDASKLKSGNAQYSAMCYEDGGIVDDLLVYCFTENTSYMLVVNGANIDKDFAWLQSNLSGFDCELKDVSDEVSLLAVQGPRSLETLQKLTDYDMSTIPFYSFGVGKLAGVDMIISRTGYTGELGFEIYFKGDDKTAENVWKAVFDAGAEYGIEPIGLAARDTLRLEKGYCLYGNDIDNTTNPIEAGLNWITKTDKGDFNGKSPIVSTKEQKPKRRLVGFIVDEKTLLPRKGYKLVKDGSEIGFVTSGNLSPVLDKPIGMGYVDFNFKDPGQKIEIAARGKTFSAEIVKIPFC